jgi:hypothetical protein
MKESPLPEKFNLRRSITGKEREHIINCTVAG